jgi:hypothetical protein
VKRIRPILVVTVALLSACAKSPTSGATPGAARHDGGNTMGSGSAVPVAPRFDGGNSLGSGNSVPTDSSQRGGNSLGSGN